MADAASAAKDPNLTPEQRAQAQQQADQLNAEWGPGGTYRQAMTALTVAAGGNVTGGMGQYAQAATVAYLQELGANEVKQIADTLGSAEARAALHAVVGCAGGAASGASCGAGAMGAAASSVIGSLLAPSDSMSAADRLVRESLVNSLVAGVATSVGASGAEVAATAAGAAQIEVQNNQVARRRPFNGEPNSYYVHPLTGDVRYFGSDGKPLLDIDVSHSHDGLKPHIHVWRDGARGNGESLF